MAKLFALFAAMSLSVKIFFFVAAKLRSFKLHRTENRFCACFYAVALFLPSLHLNWFSGPFQLID